ncbi:HEPN-associated N-terminal domain-containing protein [Candidatus Poriferisodalis sp.]|uniref:HEPN-associated N-terminal domain-containing protein n=1 Tax=Candidatus Poriferisodalis sp. TaxID=3101277 RepID=UPI003B01AEBA
MPTQFYEPTDKLICGGCVGEPALKSVVEHFAELACTCFFCDQSPAAPLDALLNAFFDGLQNEFEVVSYQGDFYRGHEDRHQKAHTSTTWQLIKKHPDAFGGELFRPGGTGPVTQPNPVLTEVYKSILEYLWVKRGGTGPRRDEALITSWNDFSHIVKFDTRFVLWRIAGDDHDDAGKIPPSQILDQVQDLIVKYDLIEEISAGTFFWRARTHNQPTVVDEASQLGTTPVDKALTGNRMSPAGIPKFYGADDVETAVREAAHHSEHKYASYGRFELTSDVLIVDFTRVPKVPSMFDPLRGAQHRELSFLHEFTDEMSQPVESAYKEFRYVPTQVVSEYLLRVRHESDPIIGLKFKSSLTGKPCVALDIPNQRCVDYDTHKPASLRLHVDSVDLCLI